MVTTFSEHIIQVIQDKAGVSIYHKESLGVSLIKLWSVSQVIVCEFFLQNGKGYIGVVYRFPMLNLKMFCLTMISFR